MHLINWELVTTPKRLGGLGIVDLKTFNQVLLAKWYWQWVSPQTKLWKNALQNMNNGTSWHHLNATHFFNSCLTQVANFLDCFILRKIGSGLTIGFWIHDWGLGILKYQYSILFTFVLDQNATVASVASQNSFDQLFHATLSVQASDQLNELVSRMSLLLTTHENARDDVVRKGNNSDIFSVKSDYFTLQNGPWIDTNVYNIWKLNVPPRFKVFAWLMMMNRILTTDNLMKKGCNMVSICVMCREDVETCKHLFSFCAFTRSLTSILLENFNFTVPDELDTSSED
jgi:zinc-binding in reverse transcriptase